MKKARTPRTHTRNHSKRRGRHHKRGNHYVKVYAPYLPLLISIVASVFLSFWQPHRGTTLAYATSMSRAGLLQATNARRSSNGVASLTQSAQLNTAAQNKANHMVAHNYWAHTSPDGQEPWAFIDAAGYSYAKAGENLAYGFATSVDAVTGWMNSPSHKANMLNSGFTQVGFGFSNSANFNGDGEQTVVVAMYAKPQVAASTTEQPSPRAPAAAAAPRSNPPPATAPQNTNPTPPAATPPADIPTQTPVTTEQPVASAMPVSKNIGRAQTLTNGNAPWALGAAVLLTGFALVTILLRHSLKARHLFHDLVKDTEKFILHHPLLDSTLLGIAILGATLSRTVGTIL